jgi:hypothetical protein
MWWIKQHNIVTCLYSVINNNGFWIGFMNTLTQSTRTCKQYSTVADLHSLQFTVTHAFSVFTSRILVTELKVSLSLNLLITHQVFTGWILILLQLLTFRAYLLPTTDSVLILVLSVVLLVLFCTPTAPSFEIRLLYFLGTDHAAQKTPLILVACCYSRVFIGSLPRNRCPSIESVTWGMFLPSRCLAMFICVTV